MRQPKPWYRKFNDTWYVQIGRRQVPLAKGQEREAEAYRRYHELMLQQDIADVPDERDINVASLCEAFLEWAQRRLADASYVWYRHLLQNFVDQHGWLKVCDLKPFHVQRWIDSRSWGQSTERGAITAVKRAVNWGVEQGFLTTSPLRSMRRPPVVARDRLVTDSQFSAMLAATDKCFADFLSALRETGARPGEVAAVTVEDVNLAAGTWQLRRHKTAAKTGRPRIIHLTPKMLEMSRTLIDLRGTGCLFRNRHGDPWSRNAIRLRMKRLRQKLDLPSDLVLHSFRHTFATNGLVNGVPLATMAELLGHSDTKMLTDHYAHLEQRADHLRAAAARAVQPEDVRTEEGRTSNGSEQSASRPGD